LIEIDGEERERVTGGEEEEEPRTALFWLLFSVSKHEGEEEEEEMGLGVTSWSCACLSGKVGCVSLGRWARWNSRPKGGRRERTRRKERDWAEREKGEGKMDQPKGREERKKKRGRERVGLGNKKLG